MGSVMIKVLVVEDDKALNELVSSYLLNYGYQPISCIDGIEALNIFAQEEIVMIISDVMMPRMDGFTLAKKVRESDKQIPILFMTALDDKISKQLGYKLEIDDYIVKPFDADLFMLRVEALLRRSNIEKTKELVAGNLRLDKEEHTAYIDEHEITLTVREFDLLYKLLSYPKKTFTRSQLMNEFWDYDSSATSRTVDVYMAKLRVKTEKCTGFEIVTVHGLGYKVVLK